MAREWTPSQSAAMELRGRLILVSAAAGSGKTSVLTERIIRTLTDPTHPADLSRILVVTFTRAAAAELKARIAAALTEALAQDPSNAHLSRQLFLLGSAKISTIDAFFQQAVRANFEQLDLPASFRMADGGELAPLCLSVFDGVVREFYEQYSTETDSDSPFSRLQGNRFAAIMDNLLSHRSDQKLDRTLLKFHSDFASYPEGIDLLDRIATELRAQADGEFFDSVAGKTVCRYLTDAFAYYAAGLAEAGNYLAVDPDAAAYFGGLHASDTDYVRAMQEALQLGVYRDARRIALTYSKTDFPKMPNKPAQMDVYYKLHGDLSSTAEAICKNHFAWSEEQLRDQMLRTADTCEMLCALFRTYEMRIFEEKKSRGVLEFNDVRALLYRLLAKPDGSITPFAQTLSEQYDAVYIDEYQDVDFLQDRIFSIIGKERRFMVGDIKQSIYSFRGSEPSIFSAYRRAMPLHTEPEADASPTVCVFMSENFRCDRPVIDFTNRICSFLFSACEGSIGYRPQDDLQCSKRPPQAPAHAPEPVQAVLFEPYPRAKKGEKKPKEKRPPREALWIAAEISRLIREETLDDGTPITPSDIAILVRAGAQGNAIAAELEKLNIPVTAPAADDPLHTPIMTQTINLLRAIDNPYRDLPLSECLLSPIGSFTLEALTEIREAAPMCKSLYDAMVTVAGEPEHPRHRQAAEWVDWLEAHRRVAAVQPADRFLRLLYLDPRIRDHANEPEMLLLYEQARSYQRTSWCGLYGFLGHISKLLEGDPLPIGGFKKAANAVTVMTIHKSKGLEFPVVFLASCGTKFNNDSLQDNLLFHRNVGFASKLYDPVSRSNENTALREAIKLEMKAEETEESIRTLYVALTRARERLYVTATVDGKIDTALANAAMLRRHSRHSILSANSYLRWILAALQEKGANNCDFPCILRKISASDEIEAVPLHTNEATPSAHLEKSLSPTLDAYREILQHAAPATNDSFLQQIPTKLAASKLRPDLLDSLNDTDDGDMALDTQIELMQAATPSFGSLLAGKSKPSAAEIGTAMHSFLQFCDLPSLPELGVEAELERLISKEFLSPETAALLRRDQLEAFAKGELPRLAKQAEHIYREQTFSLTLPLAELTRDPAKQAALADQTVFVQGSIDLLLQMPCGELLLFDYKTDRIGESERADEATLIASMQAHHGNQLACYARAVANLFGKAPDRMFIYSLPLSRAIPIEAQTTIGN